MNRAAWVIAAAASFAGCGNDGGSAAPDAASSDGGADADMTSIPRVEAASCRFEVPGSLGLTEGTGYSCGDLVTEENRGTHEGRVRLHFIRFKSSASTNRATIYLDGGPGGDGQGILEYAGFLGNAFLDGLLVDGDFLVIGQRGTRLSVPNLECGGGDCSQLQSIADLTAYNSAYNADDVDELRATLGLDKLNLYGISYGSRLGLEVLRRHGDHVRAAVIEGLVPSQVVWPAAVPASMYSAISSLSASCAAAGACGSAFGDLEAKFLTGVDALNASPLTITTSGGDFPLDGYTYSYLLFQLLYSRSSYGWLPLMISDFAAHRADRVNDLLAMVFEGGGGGGSISYGLYYSIVCGEIFNPPDFTAPETLNAGVPQGYIDLFDSFSSLASTCESWPKHDMQTALAQPVTSSVRTLVSSGRMDPITPPSFGDIAAAGLDDKIVVVHEGSGHGATLQSPCGMANLDAFLANPSAALDTSCASAITVDYVVPNMARSVPLPSKAQLRAELAIARVPPFVRDALRKRTQ